MWWKNWLITRVGCLVTVAGPRQARFYHGSTAVTVMHVLLFVLHVCMLREYSGARVTAMWVWGPGEVWSW